MAEQTSVRNYHLSYLPEEDRLLICVETGAEQEYGMTVTRRLTKQLVDALAGVVTKRQAQVQTPTSDARVKDTLLNFEHTNAVSTAVTSGEVRRGPRTSKLGTAPRLVQEIRVTPAGEGGVQLNLDDRQHTLALDLTAQRLHVLIAGLIELAGNAGWDFPAVAGWLAQSASFEAPTVPQIIH